MPRWTKQDLADYEMRQNRSQLSRAFAEPTLCYEPLAVKAIDIDCQCDNLSQVRLPYTKKQDEAIRKYYNSRIGKPVIIDELADMLDRSRWSVAIRASRLGVCNPSRSKSDEAKARMSDAQKTRALPKSEREKRSRETKSWIERLGHPKGMLGKTHSQSAKDAISVANAGAIVPIERTVRAMKTKLARYGTVNPNIKRGSWKASWRTIGGIRKFYRSRWEANYARYLDFQKRNGLIKDWVHEKETFWFEGVSRGCVSYLPDFKITNNDGSTEFHEVKGWMDAQSKTKIQRMAKYHPTVKLKVFDSKWYRANSRKLARLIKDWE